MVLGPVPRGLPGGASDGSAVLVATISIIRRRRSITTGMGPSAVLVAVNRRIRESEFGDAKRAQDAEAWYLYECVTRLDFSCNAESVVPGPVLAAAALKTGFSLLHRKIVSLAQ